MTTTFRLLDLPHIAQLHVFKSFTLFQLSLISFCSLKTKKLVESLCLTAVIRPLISGRYNNTLMIDKRPDFLIEYGLIEDVSGSNLTSSTLTSIHSKGYLPYDGQTAVVWIPGKVLLFEHLVKHLMEIFHQKGMDVILTTQAALTVESVVKTIGKFNLGKINCETLSEELMKLIPPPKQISICSTQEGQNEKWLSEVYVQNYDSLSVNRLVKVSFEDVLIMNAQSIRVEFGPIFEKQLNLFVKLWMKGSFPRLEYISLDRQHFGATLFDKVKVLKGVKHTENPEEEERIFNRSFKYWNFEYTEICKGGWDIRGKNGKNATIVLSSKYSDFEMFVWP